MTDKEIICAEIEKLRKEYDIDTTPIAKYQIAQAILNRLSDVIDSLQEEPVSEDLKKFAEEWDESPFRSDAVIAGAKWQKRKDKDEILTLKDQIESCHAAMKCKDELLEIKLLEQKQQMMKDAVDAFIYKGGIRLKEWPLPEKYGKHLAPIKLIIIKEE